MPWTIFIDRHSGGGPKEAFEILSVELPEDTAIEWFENKYGHSPYNVTCFCCGEDYNVYGANKPDLTGVIVGRGLL